MKFLWMKTILFSVLNENENWKTYPNIGEEEMLFGNTWVLVMEKFVTIAQYKVIIDVAIWLQSCKWLKRAVCFLISNCFITVEKP
jgi:hypothetical protein